MSGRRNGVLGRRARRGSVALVAAAVATIAIGFAGLAVDSTRIWLVRARLKTALDAAALTAARQFNEPTRDAEARAAFWANYNQHATREHWLGGTATQPVIAQEGQNMIRVTASASVPTTLFNIISPSVTSFSDSSTAERTGTGLEVAIVLDQTGSMDDTDGSAGMRKIDAAKRAIGTMLDVLYAGRDTRPNLWFSIVPFSTTINIGTQYANSMLNTTSPPMPAGWSLGAWSGCVEARRGGHDITEDAPVPGTATAFRPFFNASTYRQYGTVATRNCSNYYPGSSNSTRYCKGDNDWGATNTELNSNAIWDQMRDEGMPLAQRFGPNSRCALNSIQPLTASRATLDAKLEEIDALPVSGGTVIVPGLQGGWFTLSPEWQDSWGLADTAEGQRRPLAYGTRNMQKAVILLSDGEHNWYGQASYAPVSQAPELYYSAYGRPSQGLLPGFTPRNTGNRSSDERENNRRAGLALDARLRAVCNAMKVPVANGGPGIIIYVIGFEVTAGSAAETLLRNCATSPQHYFESPSAAQLQSIFTQIGNQLASLRLAR